jgi:hypothetical protein
MSVDGECSTTFSDNHDVRILRWTFRREDQSIVCELGLNHDDSAYELRVEPPAEPSAATVEWFDDAASAFDRHAAIERSLVKAGWLLEAFESMHVARGV